MQIVRSRPIVLAATVAAVLCCGCSTFGQRDDALASYEASRKQIAGVQPASYEDDEVEQPPLKPKDFAPQNFTQTYKRLIGKGPNPKIAKQHYADAETQYQQALASRQSSPQAAVEHFLAAAAAYEQAADRWPDSSLEHDALFMLGECYFFADRYPDAEDAYERLLKKFPHSKHMDRIQPRRFAIANYWLNLDEKNHQALHEFNLSDDTRPLRDTFGHAIRVFDRIRLDDPTGKLADDATLAMGNAFFARGKFLRADEYYTDLRKTFPSSEHQFRAHFLGLKAKLLSYQGPDYSANALNEAEKLLKQIRRQFPVDAEREREYLVRAHAEIRYHQAEREWLLAERYYRRAEYGASAFHYRELLDKYADTPFGPRAEERLRETDGLPPSPPQPLSWLVDLFPEEATVQPLVASDPTAPQRR